jgi:hypothetical protein
MSLVPVPEVREMVAAVKQFVAGEIHFSFLVGPIERCAWWARVHGVHSAIQRLAADWLLLVDRTWNEYGQHSNRLTVEQLRQLLAQDLGEHLIQGHESNLHA